jgi:hypothetical protein
LCVSKFHESRNLWAASRPDRNSRSRWSSSRSNATGEIPKVSTKIVRARTAGSLTWIRSCQPNKVDRVANV